jgi:hypothetical protein
MLQWLCTYVSSTCSKCFIYRRKLQVFSSRCCKSRSGCCIYICTLQAYVSSVFRCFIHMCCKCFIWMLHMFAMIFICFLDVFASVSDTCFKCFICLFFFMLQLLYLDVSNVSRSGVAHGDTRGKRPTTQTTSGTAWVTSGAARGHCWCASSQVRRARSALCRQHPDARVQIRYPGASKSVGGNTYPLDLSPTVIPQCRDSTTWGLVLLLRKGNLESKI